jgi:hypothetical protein
MVSIIMRNVLDSTNIHILFPKFYNNGQVIKLLKSKIACRVLRQKLSQ